jgi:hypothetical protein
MPKSSMKNAFNYAVNLFHPKPQRFIDIDGRPWFKKTVLDKIDPVYVIGGGIALASVFAASAMAPEGQKLAEAFNQLSLAGMAFGLGVLNLKISNTFTSKSATVKLREYAIDKTGKSLPPVHNEKLRHLTSIKKNNAQSNCLLGVPLDALVMVLILHIPLELTGAILGLTLMKSGGDYIRCKKLLNGTYTFCGTPPAELKKAEARSTRRFGVLAPSAA